MVNGILVRVDEFWFFEPRFTMIVYIKFPVQLAKFWIEWKGSVIKKLCLQMLLVLYLCG
jgi:site-specific recombinase